MQAKQKLTLRCLDNLFFLLFLAANQMQTQLSFCFNDQINMVYDPQLLQSQTPYNNTANQKM